MLKKMGYNKCGEDDMEIRRVIPSGYCQGVVQAIRKVQETVKKFPDEKIYVLGMIVHNRYVVEAFEQLGVITLEDPEKTKEELLDDITDGVVIFTAHGISENIKKKAVDKGLTVVDAACKYVLKNLLLIKEYLSDGYEIVYIGKRNHPESDAALSIDDKIHLVTSIAEIDSLEIQSDRIMVTNQTTMSIYDTQQLIEAIIAKYPHAVILEEICDATRQRQNAIMKLQNVDTLVIVGDPASNNTAQLTRLGKRNGIENVVQIENANDLVQYDFSSSNSIAVTAGASTPKYLTDNVIDYLKTNDPKYLQVNISKILK